MRVVETAEFSTWLTGLRDATGGRAIVRRLVKLQATGHFGDVVTIDSDLSEMRVHVGPGYRIYFTMRDGVILLRGGAKATQARDINAARDAIGNL